MAEKFRISDIFKKSKDGKKPPTQGIRFFKPRPEEGKKKREQPSDKIDFSSVVDKETERKDDIEKKEYIEREEKIIDSALYSEAVSLARKIYKDQVEKTDISVHIYSTVERIVDSIISDNKELLQSALAGYLQPKDYIYYNAVNVCILSICLGQGLAYDRLRLVELGIAAFCHDIGIFRYLDIINQHRRLTVQEYGEVKQHPIIGPQILTKLNKNFDVSVFDVLRQEHERIDGSGYPKGLKSDEITEYAQIVGLSDVYEAMIHIRPYRDKHSPLETIKEILSDKYTFAHKLVKILIDKIGIFPLGTIVRLNTKEVGQVIQHNPQLPLRPVVDIMFDSSGKRLKSARRIDLADSPTVYILGPSSMPIEGTPDAG